MNVSPLPPGPGDANLRQRRKPERFANLYGARSFPPMHISSPFLVVPVIIGVFVISILFSTSSKEDNGHSH